MIRIVGVQRHEDPRQEFVLLQNQGAMRVNLRGHALLAECSMDDPSGFQEAYILRDDVYLMPGQYVLVRTSPGTSRWDMRVEGYVTYYTHLNRESSVWDRLGGRIHLLAPQHSYSHRADSILV